MILVPLLLTPIAFAGGLYLVAKFAPELAPTRTGRVASRVVDLLGGAAAAVFALNVFIVVRTATDDSFADALAYAIAETLWQSGVLLAGAAAVHLLAPPPDDD